MAYENLKAAIKQAIKQNGNQEITGNLLQSALLNIVNTLGADYKFLGFAMPSTVPPTSEEGRLFYFASKAGEYINFPTTSENTHVVTENGLYLLTKEANSNYWKEDILIEIAQEFGEADNKVISQKAVSDKFSNLSEEVNSKIGKQIFVLQEKSTTPSNPINLKWNIQAKDSDTLYCSFNSKAEFPNGGLNVLVKFEDDKYVIAFVLRQYNKEYSYYNNSGKAIKEISINDSTVYEEAQTFSGVLNVITEGSISDDIVGLSSRINANKETINTNKQNIAANSTKIAGVEDSIGKQNGILLNKRSFTAKTNILDSKNFKVGTVVDYIFVMKKASLGFIKVFDKEGNDYNIIASETAKLTKDKIFSGSILIEAKYSHIELKIYGDSYFEASALDTSKALVKNIEQDMVVADLEHLPISDLNDSNTPVSPENNYQNANWSWQAAYLDTINNNLKYSSYEYQTRLIPVKEFVSYKYKGYFSSTAGIGFYGHNKKLVFAKSAYEIQGVKVPTDNTIVKECIFTIPKGIGYITFNWNKFSGDSNYPVLTELAGLYKIDSCQFPITGTVIKNLPALCNSLAVKEGNKYFGIQQSLSKNINNYDGELNLLKFSDSFNNSYRIFISHSVAKASLLPQKENTANEPTIKMVEFPMSVFTQYLKVEANGKELASLVLDGTKYKTFVRTCPAFTIRYIPKEAENLSENNIRFYTTKDSNNVVSAFIIKDGENIILKYNVDATKELVSVYKGFKEAVEKIQGYTFTVEFFDIDASSVTNLVAVKDEGLPFVTEYSSDCLSSGTLQYDNYPVFVEVLRDEIFDIELVENNNRLYIYYDGCYFTKLYNDFTKLEYNFGGTNNIKINYDPYHNTANGHNPLLRGLTGHEMTTEPAYPQGEASGGTPVGYASYVCHKMKQMGWSIVSTNDVAKYMKDKNYPMPQKCFFIENDDLGGRQGINKIFSDEEPYIHQMEILKMNGITMNFALYMHGDYELFCKIKDGTATAEEKSKLTRIFTETELRRLKSLMNSYNWGVAIHTFVGPEKYVTAASFDNIVKSIRNSIWWYERMFDRTPLTYVTDLTGNSSPYFRRVLQMYGLLCVGQDGLLNYSDGRAQTFYNRDGFYFRTEFGDYDYNNGPNFSK